MKRLLVLVLLVLLCDVPAWGAVAYDTFSESGCAGCDTDSWSHTTTGSNTFMLCGGGVHDFGGSTTIGITYNSAALTVKDSAVSSAYIATVYKRTAPTTGTNTVAVTYSQAVNSALGCLTFTGVDQGTPDGTAVTAADTVGTLDASITVLADGMGASFAAYSDSGNGACVDSTAGETERFEICSDVGAGVQGMASTTTSTGTVVMDWTFVTASYSALVAIPINPAGAAGSSSRRIIQVQ
jgi:hypothetical protein